MQSEQLLANNIRRDNGVKTHNSCKEVQFKSCCPV